MSDETIRKMRKLIDLHKQAYTPIKEQEEERKRKALIEESRTLSEFKRSDTT